MDVKRVLDRADLFSVSQMALRDLYVTPPDDRDSDWYASVEMAAENRKTAYNELMDDPEVFLSLSTGGLLRLGNISLRGILIQPGKTKDLEKEWLRQSPTYHFIKLKIEGIRR